MIESAKKSQEAELAKIEEKGKKDLAELSNKLSSQKETINLRAEQEISKIKQDEKRSLSQKLKKVEDIDGRQISKTADLVMKKIVSNS